MTAAAHDLEWRGDRLALRPARLEDVPGIVAFYRTLEPSIAPDDDSPVGWFAMGGPWMHEYFCSRHVQAYTNLGWDCWVVERNSEKIVGSVEICYATEPEPFGRYAHLELLELSEDIRHDGIEEWVLDLCESRARARGYDRFWCRPVGSGGSWDVLARRGYVEVWRNGWLSVRGLDHIEVPAFQDCQVRGDYDTEAAHLLALNHRESASYRWRYLWRPVLTPEASDFPTDVSLYGRHITVSGRPAAAVLLNIWKWRHPGSAWADLWVEPDMSRDVVYLSDLLSVAGRQAHAMGASSMEVVLPESVRYEIERRFDAVVVPLERGDPWLVKGLSPLAESNRGSA